MSETMAKATKDQVKLLVKIKDRYQLMVDADKEQRALAMADMEFATVPGKQWDSNMKIERDKRPCYEFNKVRISGKRIINDIRANRPQGKVRGVEGGDKETAEIYEGLIRNIWNVSDGDTVVDYAAEYQVFSGMGAWRVVTEYASDDMFEQDIRVVMLPNPYCLFPDPAAKDLMRRDARDWILTERIPVKEYEDKWPNAAKVDWEDSEYDDKDDDGAWQTEETIRVAEYWWKEPCQKEIWQLMDGKVIDSSSDEAAAIGKDQIKNTRIVDTHKIMMCVASGQAILEGPVEWAGKHHPFIMVHGEYIIVDGKTYWYGVTRWAKDAQRSYNVSRTAITETIAQAPQAKWWTTAKQAEGHTNKWAEAHQKNFPFLLYNADPAAGGPPTRMGGADVPVALIQESQLASQEIDAVTGIYQDDRGEDSRSQSGRAIYARQNQGQITTFNYQDNLSKGIQWTWEILIDLVPKIYDTEREMRLLGSDGAEDYVRINTFVQDQETGEQIKINDLTHGRYDVNITIGPSFSSRRQEAAETYQQLVQGNPAIFPIAGDLIFKSMDLPYADEIAERLKALLPPEIQAMQNKDAQMPPEVQQMMGQAQQAMQVVEQQMQQVQQAAGEVEQGKAEADQAKAEVQTAVANLKAQEAQFGAKVAQQVATIAEKQSALKVAEMQLEQHVDQSAVSNDRQVLAESVEAAVDTISALVVDFTNQAVGVMGEIQNKRDEPRPKVIRIESKRVNGKLEAVPIYEEPVSVQ